MALVLGLLWLNSTGQTITIKDAESDLPLDLVSLYSENPPANTLTNSKGMANVGAFKGSSKIYIRILGYKPLEMTYTQLEALDFNVEMEPSNISLNEVVVSGTRWRQVSDNVPSKIITITPREAALQNPQTAADLLGISGKVYIQKSQQGGGSPMIRGFSTNRLLYTVDGVRMNTAIFRSGNLQNVISLDPLAMESAEVLFGPGSVIYGSDAIGGVMSFQTLTPQFTLDEDVLVSGKGTARYSSANTERTAHADVNVGWKNWAMVTSITASEFGHLRQGQFGPSDYLRPYHVQQINGVDQVVTQDDPLLQIPTAYSQYNLMQKVRFAPSKRWNLEYGFHLSETSSYGRYDRHNRERAGLPRYAEWNYGPQRWMMNNVSVSHLADRGIYDRFTLRAAFQKFEESRISRDLNAPTREVNAEKVDAFSVNLDFNKELGARHTLFYGAEAVQNLVVSSGSLQQVVGGVNRSGPSRYPNATWSSLAVYANDEFRVSERFTLQGGVRYNHFLLDADFAQNLAYYPLPFQRVTLNNGAVTGSLGGVYRPTDKWVLSANFGTGFRAPNVDDLGKVFDSEPGSVVVPNRDLNAEIAYNAELGIARVFGDWLKLDITGYYTILEQAMVRRDFMLNGLDSIMYEGELSKVQAVQNAAAANVYGIQAGMEVKLPAGFSMHADVNFQEGREEMDDGTVSPSRHAPPTFGTARFIYSRQKVSLQVYTLWQAAFSHDQLAIEERAKTEIYALDAAGNTHAPAWYTLNFKAAFKVNDWLTLNSGLENITDQRYRSYSSGVSGAGRNFILSATARF